jgi:DNA-binding transcriptional LysR family regulator
MQNIDLRDLNAFQAVARHRNFRRAAVEQRMSVSTLSQNIKELEERLGVRLLNRTTRSVAPTEAGERLLSRLGPALRDVFDAVGEIQSFRNVPAGRLRINAPEPAVALVLAPMVTPFLQRYPEIQLEIVADTSLIDIVNEGFDAGVRYEEHLARDMIAVSLGPPQRYALVASPGFIEKHGVPKHPKDLLGKPSIATRFPNGKLLPWEFEKGRRVVKIEPEGALVCLHSELKVRAALDGLGYLTTFEGYLRQHIKEGRLIEVLSDWLPPFPGPFLYYPSRRQQPPALSAFVAFVREWRKQQGE